MARVRTVRSAEAPPALLDEVRRLLRSAFEDGFSDDDWAHTLGGTHVLLYADDRVVAHAAVVPRLLHVAGRAVRAGYVEGVATDPARRRAGLGTAVMRRVGELVRRDYEMGALSTGSHLFYERCAARRRRTST